MISLCRTTLRNPNDRFGFMRLKAERNEGNYPKQADFHKSFPHPNLCN